MPSRHERIKMAMNNILDGATWLRRAEAHLEDMGKHDIAAPINVMALGVDRLAVDVWNLLDLKCAKCGRPAKAMRMDPLRCDRDDCGKDDA